MSLTTKSASVPVVETCRCDVDRAGDGEVVVERRRLVDEHVGPRGGEALILGHVVARHAAGDVADVRHGWVGSLTYSSKARGLPAASADSAPAACEVERRRLRVLRAARRRAAASALVPVSKIQRLGQLRLGLPFRWCWKNGNSICSRKNSAGLRRRSRGCRARSPSPRAQPPCDHGPITSMFGVAGFCLSIAR